MKQLFALAMLLGSLHSFAQKTFEIYNYTGYTIDVADIITKPSGAAIYPEIHSKPHGLFSIPPGGSFILENTSHVYRFPYNSTVSSPSRPGKD